VWKPDHGNVDDDLGDYWHAIVRHLEALVRHSLEAFMFQVDHDIIHVDDDLGYYWHAIVRHLEALVRHSLEAFMFQVDHDIIRVFREGKISVKLFVR